MNLCRASKPSFKNLVEAHEFGIYAEGPEALAARDNGLVEGAELVEEVEHCDIDIMGCFPGNMELDNGAFKCTWLAQRCIDG